MKTKKQYNQWIQQQVNNFNKDHASVLINGNHRIIRKDVDPLNGTVDHIFIKQNDFHNIHQNNFFEDEDGKSIAATKAWLKHPSCEKYPGGVCLKPFPYGKPNPFDSDPIDKRRYNLWNGFGVIPLESSEPKLEEKLSLVLEHIFTVICDNNDELADYVINWIAFTFQNPDKPAGVAVILSGEKGTGKGIFGHFLRKIWGNHGLQLGQQHLAKSFNAQLKNACFLFADEAFCSDQKKDEATLKMLITEPSVRVELKGVDAYSQPNYLKILMATNDDHVVAASKDERRYCFCDVSNAKQGNKAYFDALSKACDDPSVQACFLYHMIKRDIKNFNIGAIPETKGLQNQRFNSLNSVGQWLSDSLFMGNFGVTDADGDSTWSTSLSSEALANSYTAWVDEKRITPAKRLSKSQVLEYLGKVGYKKKRTKTTEGKEKRGYFFGELKDAIELFEKYEKIKVITD